MVNYLSKLLILVIFSFIIIYNYYYVFPVHMENFNGYLPYILILWVIYWIYKVFTIKLCKEKISFTPLGLFLFFLLHLFILSGLFFTLSWASFSSGFILFFKIVSYSVLPLFIILITSSFWYKILWKIKNFNNETSVFRYLSSLWVGFSSFLFLVACFWVLWFYNLYIVFSILILFLWLWFKEFIAFFDFVFNYKLEFKNHNFSSESFVKNISPKLLSSELLFIVATFILSVNLISIVRPFPIWWDDLWVYMNYPRILAWSWTLDLLWWMFSWQTFTGIWFMFNSPNQAFFLNALGWFMSFIVLMLVIKDLLINNDWEKEKQDTIINIPLLIATIFISMPMIIFQQAKDMKLDPGLFFVSLIALYMFYYLYKSYFRDKEVKEKLDKTRLIYFFVIWIICWLAFSIKFTSLMLISWIFWVLFFVRLWIAWFLWYLSIYFSIFTWLWLWSRLNVVFPDSPVFKKTFLIVWILSWIMLLVYSKIKYKKNFKILFLKLWVILLWLSIFLIPWVWKNLSQADNISVSSILSWQNKSFKADYNKIYDKPELEKINNIYISASINSSWVTSNEDYWRYFGYEKWINNYIKLPWNLTMQKNQWWEFTDITFIFLALLPVILLFLPYRRKYLPYLIIVPVLILELSLFVFWWTWSTLTNIFSNISLPFGYVFILFSLLIFLIFRYSLVKWVKNIKIFKLNLIFTIFYTFLWTISAYWIVWYWIMMYFWFLLMIAIWLYYLSNYNNKSSEKVINTKILWTGVVFLIICFHFFFSVMPHWFNNLQKAWYLEFKKSDFTTDEAVFAYHREYLKLLFELNIKPEKRDEFVKTTVSKQLIQQFPNIINPNIEIVIWSLNQIINAKDIPLEYKKLAMNSRKNIYAWILRPKKDQINQGSIYRIGTFLKYFISNNSTRLLEDSLINNFDRYIYDKDTNVTVERIKKLWLNYFLIDLNAATIDKDPRRDLTRRYEHLLKTFTSDNLELVQTDSICLMVALESYKKSDKSDKALDDYILLSGVNFETFLADWSVISRWMKLSNCYNVVVNLIKEKKIDEKNYSFLFNLYNHINSPQIKNTIKTDQDLLKFLSQYISHWFKVLFKVN